MNTEERNAFRRLLNEVRLVIGGARPLNEDYSAVEKARLWDLLSATTKAREFFDDTDLE